MAALTPARRRLGARCVLVGAGALMLAPASLNAQGAAPSEPSPPLLGFCAPPVVPRCIDELKAHAERWRACGPEADAYVVSVFRYRICLTRETERAVREANEAIAKLHCAQKRQRC